MKVAICGAGSVGCFIASDLAESGHEITLIEKDPTVVSKTSIDERVQWEIADACEVTALQKAKLDETDVVVAATGDDEDNLVISLLAKQEFAVPRVIARVNHPENMWLFNENWGVDVSVSTPHLLSALVEEAVSVGSLVRLLQFEGGRARLVEITIDESSPSSGKTIAELTLPRDAIIVAIVRHKHLVVPHGDTVFAPGDEILALVTSDSEPTLQKLFESKNRSH